MKVDLEDLILCTDNIRVQSLRSILAEKMLKTTEDTIKTGLEGR